MQFSGVAALTALTHLDLCCLLMRETQHAAQLEGVLSALPTLSRLCIWGELQGCDRDQHFGDDANHELAVFSFIASDAAMQVLRFNFILDSQSTATFGGHQLEKLQLGSLSAM